MKAAIESNHLENQINLSAAFCLGKCTDGVSIKVNDEIICGVSKDNFDEIFDQYILTQL